MLHWRSRERHPLQLKSGQSPGASVFVGSYTEKDGLDVAMAEVVLFL